MKKFKYKFTKATTAFIYIGIALCVIGLGINLYSVITGDIASSANPVYPIIQHTLMFLIPIVLLVILISLLISSYYSINENYFKISFGIIKSKCDVNDIETILLDRPTHKLNLFFKNKSFIVIGVKEEWYEDFIDALCAANPQIEYKINSIENTGDNNDKKE